MEQICRKTCNLCNKGIFVCLRFNLAIALQTVFRKLEIDTSFHNKYISNFFCNSIQCQLIGILTYWNINLETFTPLYKLCQIKDDKERRYFSLKTMFWKCLLLLLKCVWKVHHKKWTFYWRKVYKNVIYWIVATNALARFRIVAHCYATSFSRKIILCQTNNIFYSIQSVS